MPTKDWSAFFADLGKLLRDMQNNTTGDWTIIFADLALLLNDAADNSPPPIAGAITTFKAAMPTAAEPTARDWAGFFAAIAAFMQQILPLILPLFKK